MKSMKRRLVVATMACWWVHDVARAAELRLFNLELRDTTQASLHAAALAADARLLSSSGGHRIYDASRVGLPGARTLETLFDSERFVVAAYSFKRGSNGDHELRRLLVGKYGEAHILLSDGKRHEVNLAEHYPGFVEYRWDVDAPMDLIYNTMEGAPQSPGKFDRETRLTYVNRPLFDALRQRTAETRKQADRERAGRLKGAL